MMGKTEKLLTEARVNPNLIIGNKIVISLSYRD